VAARQRNSPKNLQAVMLVIQQKMFDGFGVLEDNFSEPGSGTVTGAEPDYFWRNAVFELDVEEVFVEGENGVEVILPGVLEDFEIVEIRKAQFPDMENIRENSLDEGQEPEGNILVYQNVH
jgi:hypothetical protein